jgi:hypothetical protein
MSRVATRKLGSEIPSPVKMRTPWSKADPGLSAARIPIGMPRRIAQANASSTSSNERGAISLMMSLTRMYLNESEGPRSNVATPFR